FELLVNATPLGREPDDPLPFAVDRLAPGEVVIDLVYPLDGGVDDAGGEAGLPLPTRVLAAAAAQGAVAIDGREVLLDQALGQFRRMTGREMPRDLARELLGLPAPAARMAPAR